MPKISDIAVLRQREMPTLVIRKMTTIAELQELIGMSFQKIMQYLETKGGHIADMPFVLYHNFDFKKMDVEIGFPVSEKIEGADDIQANVIPEQDMVFCMYQGAYNKIASTYEAMNAWNAEHGLEVEEKVYEFYYNGPEVGEESLLTKIMMPVKI